MTEPLSRRAAYFGLSVVTLLNFLNYIDRFILAAVMPRIKADLALSDFALGMLANAFLVAYFLTSPFFGWMGDRRGRPQLMAAGVALWSVFTAAGGLVQTFTQFMFARAGVGVGEAAYATISPALLSDYFPEASRGKAFAVFYVAIPVGAAIGFLLGGVLEQAFGWRAAFYVVGLPGIGLALLALKVPDPPRGASDEPRHAEAVRRRTRSLKTWPMKIRALARNLPYVGTVFGYAAYTFAVGGLAVWMPTYLERVRGVELTRADFIVGGVTVAAGLGGTFLGGYLGDRLSARMKSGHLWLSAATTLAAAVPAWFALTLSSPQAYLCNFFAAEFLLFISTSPINVVLVSVVPVEVRATAMAVSIFAIHALGDAISPPIIGAIADHAGLGRAVLIVPGMAGVSGLIWLWTARVSQRG